MATLQVVADQINRLKSRFGDKAFDDEFVKLVKAELRTMNDGSVIRCVDVFIGSRTHNRPPLLTDFREARLNEERNAFQRDVAGAAKVLTHPSFRPLQEVLRQDFGAVDSVADALEIARLKLRTRTDNEGA